MTTLVGYEHSRMCIVETTSLTSVIIGNSVENIGESAFYFCKGLTTVTLGSGVKTIGQEAFRGCNNTGFTTVNIPNSVTSIGLGAFEGCTDLTTVTLNSNPTIDTNAFYAATTVTMNLTANAAGGAYWMTFYNQNYNFEADANTQVFKAALSGTGLTLHEVTNRIVNANTPVILKSTGNPVMTKTSSASGDSQDNSLVGTTAEMTGAAGNIYVLNNGIQGVGFYKLKATEPYGTIGANKAYLQTNSAAREFFLFDEATGIESIDHSPLTIDHSVYDLQGRRVAQPTKGMYIVNGKKVIK